MKYLVLITLLFSSAFSFSQTDVPYAEKAIQIQKEIWGSPTAEFKLTQVPVKYSNEGAVVLARSYNMQRSSTDKYKFIIVTAATTTHTVRITTFHERVKLNDKASLEAYSTVSYQKKLDKTEHKHFAKYTNTNNIFIGAKIIKPDGKEVIVNTGEEVLLKNETKDQKGKLAIPGLEVGDILDYYISDIDVNDTMNEDTYADNDKLFVLTDDYPILNYNLDFQFGKKIEIRYIYGNGAPHFTESTNDAGDQLLSLKLHDIPKYENQVWTSPLRQYPYIEIASNYATSANKAAVYDKDKSRFENMKAEFENQYVDLQGYNELESRVKDHFKSHKEFKAASADTLAKVLYDQWKYLAFDSYDGSELGNFDDMNYRSARDGITAKLIGLTLTDMKVDYSILLVASRNSNTLENAFNSDDFGYMIRINGSKPLYMAFDNIAIDFNEIPDRFQGEKAIALTPDRHGASDYRFKEENIQLPVIQADKNNINARLQVSLLPENMQKLKIDRMVTETGALRIDDQLNLVPVQDIDNNLMTLANGKSLKYRLYSVLPVKTRDDFPAAFQKQADNISKNFTDEIKGEFEQDPEKVENCKLIEPGLNSDKPELQFSSSFILNNLVKKAGDNYIIDAGMLTGSFYKLPDNDRKRNVDIYMPSARSFNYTILITIPPGYEAKGMEEMTVKKANKTGSFSSAASVAGNVLTISINRVYSDNFEKLGDWSLVTELIDVASNFNTQKILFEKKR